MNDEHTNEKDFKKYGESKLSPPEFLRVHSHLENCEDCRRRLDKMFPNIARKEEALVLESLREEKANDFHLNYEEHLKPFIYGKIDAVDKEIVESHIEICAECREDLRDLLNFHQELEREKEIRQLSKANWWKSLTDWFSAPNRKMVWLAFASLVLIVGAISIWLFVGRSSDEIAEIPVNSGNFQINQTSPNINANQALINTNHNSNALKVNSNKQNQTEIVPEKEVEMTNLVLPKFLKDLKMEKVGTLLGSDNSPTQEIVVISPNSSVIRDSSPVLMWRNIPNIQTYEVAVFDENDNRLAKNDAVSGNSWRVSDLPKGRIYKWQVSAKSVSGEGKTTNFIGQGKFYIVSEHDENRINQAKDALEKGKAFAEAGLLREAAAEFHKFLKENPNSEPTRKILRQVEQAQR